MDASKGGLSQSVKKGAAWTFLGRVLVFGSNMGGSIFLARLLEPEDFGVFGIALLFVGLATRLGNVGFGLALVQREKIEKAHISSLFVVNLGLFSTMAVLLMWFSADIGRYFNNAISGDVLFVLAFGFFLRPFSSVARALLQRRMDFKSTAIETTLQHFVGVLSSVILAWNGFGVWSLVYGEMIRSLITMVTLMYFARWWPSLFYNHRAMRDLFRFGIAILLKRLLTYGSDKADLFIIGKRLEVASLGFYEKAYALMNMAIKELANRMEPVLFRAFSVIQNDRGRILAAYNKVMLTFSLLSYPIFLGLASVAPPFISLLYGEKWMPSVMPLQIMCLSGIFRFQLKITTIVMNAIGKIKVEAWLRSAGFVSLLLACWIGSQWGIVGVAIAATLVNGILSVAMTIYFGKLSRLGFFDLIRPQSSPFIASAFMYITVLFFRYRFSGMLGPASILFSAVLVGIFSYIGALFVMKPVSVVALAKECRADIAPFIQKFSR